MKRTCSIDGCEREHHSHGYCAAHSRRFTRGRPVDGPVKYQTHKGGASRNCKVPDCPNGRARGRSYCRSYCYTHYSRHQRGADLNAPVRKYRPRSTTMEDVTWMIEQGATTLEAAQAVKRSLATVADISRKYGRPDLARKFDSAYNREKRWHDGEKVGGSR